MTDRQLDRQPRIIDLVPQRYVTFGLLLVAGVGAIAALEAAYYWMATIAAFAGTDRLAAFDLESPGSLAGWLSSVWAAMAGMTAIIVYGVRKHKADDYHGRYRIWLWAAACFLGTSAAQSGSVHHAFAQLMSHLSGRHPHAAAWWLAALALVAGPVVVRLLLEMRRCRLSTSMLVASLGCYGLAGVAKLGALATLDARSVVMTAAAGELAGNLLLLAGMVLHARFVIRDAHGLIAVRKPKAIEKSSAKTASSAGSSAHAAAAAKRNDLDAPASRTTAASAAAAAKRNQHDTDDDEDDYDDAYGDRAARRSRPRHRVDDEEEVVGGRKLSKADRKLMRRQKQQERGLE